MLHPKKVKHRKWQKGKSKGMASKGTEVSFGSFGLKSLDKKWITSRQIEAARRVMLRFLQKKGKLWIRIFPDKPVSNKGQEVPMGGGKGSVDHYVYPVKPGRVMFELEGVDEDTAREAFRKATAKLPVKTKFVKRDEL